MLTFARLWLLAGLILPALGLGACNTIAGLGEDTQAAGDAIEDTAEDAERELSE